MYCKTIVENIVVETENFGQSEIEVTGSTRTVLYGDDRLTNATTESISWENHPR